MQSTINEYLAQVSSLNAECELFKKRNQEMSDSMIQYRKIDTQFKEQSENMDDLMTKLDAEQQEKEKLLNELREKNQIISDLERRCKELVSAGDVHKRRIKKLHLQVQDLSTRQLTQDDETRHILKTYKTQIVKVEENKKLIELLEQQAGEWQTKYELQKENSVRLTASELNYQTMNEDLEHELDKLRAENLELHKKLDMGKHGDTKKNSTMALLEKNVITLESIVRSKDFEIKQLRNANKAKGISNAGVDQAKMKRVEKELRSAQKAVTKIGIKMERVKADVSELKAQIKSKNELLGTKNQTIAQQKFQLQELEQNAVLSLQKVNEEKQDARRLSANLARKKVDTQQLEMGVGKLQAELKKVTKKLQSKIDKLETELLLKDDVLSNIKSQYGINDVRSTHEEEIDMATANELNLGVI
jgi:chromosome segregation ATPase